MKLAFLVDIHTENVIMFEQRLEDLINKFEGRLIHVERSRYPIRIVPAEKLEYPLSDTPVGPVEKGREVKFGTQGNGRWRLDDYNRPFDGSRRNPCGIVPDVHQQLDRLPQCDGKQLDGGRSRNDHPDSGRRWGPSAFRLCVPPIEAQGTEVGTSSPTYDLTYDVRGAPLYPEAREA